MSSKTESQPRVISIPLAWSYFAVATLSFGAGALLTWGIMRNPVAGPASSAAITQQAQSGVAEETPPPAEPGQSAAQRSLMLGNWYYDQRRWPEAIAQYQTAIASGLDNPDIQTDLGNCYRFSGWTDKALEQYQKAQSEDPHHEQSLFNTVTLYGEVLHDSAKASAAAAEYLSRFSTGEHVELVRKFLSGPISANEASKQPLVLKQQPEPAAKAELRDWMTQQQ